MPIEAAPDHAHKLIVSTATGHITLRDLHEYFGTIWTESKYRGYSEIIDWRRAERVDLSVAELRSLAGAAHAFYDKAAPTKLAIVIQGADGNRMAQLYRTLREVRGSAPDIRVFEDVEEAKAWMGAAGTRRKAD